MIEILIADDHRVFREGIASILDEVEDLTVIGEASNGEEVMTLLDSLTPNVILMDITMGQSSGIPYTKLVKEKFPHIAVLALSMHGESAYIVKMLEAGATGYLLKDAGKLELIRAIRTVAEGNTYFSKQVNV